MLVFLWWWWAWLSALVNIFFDLWFQDIVVVDKYKSEISEKLEKKWIKVVIWDGIYNFQNDDIIFYSDAVVNSKDFQKVKNNTKWTYFQFIWEISKWFQTISIAWTHWKTSTTSIALTVWKNIWFDKLWLGIVGWFVPDLDNKNYFINDNYKQDIKTIFEKLLTKKWARPSELFKKLYFFIEADEFNRHFLLLDNYISLITKVDHDHVDIYPTEKEYLQAFITFLNKTRKISYTTDIAFYNKIKDKMNYPDQLVLIKKNNNINFKYIFWEHMKSNASLVLELFKKLWFEEKDILEKISNFKWVWRRQEYLGEINNLKIYTDYAHHPIEIEATYNSFRKNFPDEKLIWVFQPHQLFRFVSYEEDFIKILKKFDKIYIYDIYSVRENNLLKELTWKDLPIEEQKKIIWEKIANKINWEYIENFDNLTKKIQQENGILIIMTAGDLDYKIRKYIK